MDHRPDRTTDARRSGLRVPDIKTLGLSALGGTLEYYDFVIYVFFASVIGKLFFWAHFLQKNNGIAPSEALAANVIASRGTTPSPGSSSRPWSSSRSSAFAPFRPPSAPAGFRQDQLTR